MLHFMRLCNDGRPGNTVSHASRYFQYSCATSFLGCVRRYQAYGRFFAWRRIESDAASAVPPMIAEIETGGVHRGYPYIAMSRPVIHSTSDASEAVSCSRHLFRRSLVNGPAACRGQEYGPGTGAAFSRIEGSQLSSMCAQIRASSCSGWVTNAS